MTLSLEINFKENLDVFSFFPVNHAIFCPESLWFRCVLTSLRMKHSVFILNSPLIDFPSHETNQRWIHGEDWCWLSTRSSGPLRQHFPSGPSSLQELISFLTNYSKS
jgi:hypothetical protein